MTYSSMKRKTYIYSFFGWLLLVALTVALPSCSDSDFSQEEERPSEGKSVSVVIKAPGNNVLTRGNNPQTRGNDNLEGFTPDPTKNELIHSCTVAFVQHDAADNTKGKVSVLITLDESEPGYTDKSFNAYLQEGNYTLVALANVTDSELTDLGIQKDAEVTLTDLMAETYNIDEKTLDANTAIPMSGYIQDIRVDAAQKVYINNEEQTSEVVVNLVRLVGKVEFQFTNTTSEKVTVNSITFLPIAKGDFKLFHYPKNNEAPDMTEVTTVSTAEEGVPLFKPNNISLAAKTETGSENTETGSENTDEGTENSGGTTASYSIYLREVASTHPTGCFPISISITRGEGESAHTETMTALLYDLNYINRNDWIRVPITLTDRKLELDVVFYPPIGGYPPVDWTDKDDEYYVTFATGGYFSINTLVTDKANGTTVNPKYVSVEVKSITDKVTATTEEGGTSTGNGEKKKFFRRTPSVDTTTGELVGEINSGLNDGDSSIVTIEVNLTEKDNNDNLITSETFLRKIHFIYTPPTTNNNTND